jgi:hypothetical protein
VHNKNFIAKYVLKDDGTVTESIEEGKVEAPPTTAGAKTEGKEKAGDASAPKSEEEKKNKEEAKNPDTNKQESGDKVTSLSDPKQWKEYFSKAKPNGGLGGIVKLVPGTKGILVAGEVAPDRRNYVYLLFPTKDAEDTDYKAMAFSYGVLACQDELTCIDEDSEGYTIRIVGIVPEPNPITMIYRNSRSSKGEYKCQGSTVLCKLEGDPQPKVHVYRLRKNDWMKNDKYKINPDPPYDATEVVAVQGREWLLTSGAVKALPQYTLRVDLDDWQTKLKEFLKKPTDGASNIFFDTDDKVKTLIAYTQQEILSDKDKVKDQTKSLPSLRILLSSDKSDDAKKFECAAYFFNEGSSPHPQVLVRDKAGKIAVVDESKPEPLELHNICPNLTGESEVVKSDGT